MDEKKTNEFNEIYDFVESYIPGWERLQTDGQYKIKTNKDKIPFPFIEKILKKFNLRITEISFSDYYGIVFGIEKLESN